MDINTVLTQEHFLQTLPIVIEQSSKMMVITDCQGSIEYVNRTFLELTGYAKEEIFGKNLLFLKSGQHAAEFYQNLWDTVTLGQEWQGEMHITKKNGERYWESTRIIPMKDDSGTIKRFVAIMENTTEQKQAEKTLKERLLFEKLLSDLSAHFVNVPSDRVDAEIQEALQQILNFFKVDRCGLLQTFPEKKTWQITHAAFAEGVPLLPMGKELPASLFPWSYDMLTRKHQVVSFPSIDDMPPEANIDKQTFLDWGIRANLNIPITIGKPIEHIIAIDAVRTDCIGSQDLIPRLRLLGEVFVNALERSKVDQALRAGEERLILAASAAEAGLWILNTETEHLWATQMLRELFHLSQEENLTFKDFLATIHPDDRQRVQELTRKSIVTRKLDSVEYRVLQPDGSIRWFVTRGQPYADVQGQPTRLMGATIDITERKKMDARFREQLAEIKRLKRQLEKENKYLREEVKSELGIDKIVGESDVIQYVLFRAQQVAPTDATVLILGETGTGKGLVAHAIHEMSARKNKPMVTVNCAALPANLIESELFGREKGAFTGAHARQSGRFEVADGGTIFLDEIGEMPLELQVKLLRVLQDGEFERLGGSRTIKVDVRVIAATNRDLKTDIVNGLFREDLYYRLNVFPVSIPPLRIRTNDIPMLTQYFIDKYAQKFGKHFETLARDTMRMLESYHWPGNVRELEHVIERSVITSHDPVFQLADQLEHKAAEVPTEPNKEFDKMARKHVLQVLLETNWKIDGKDGAASVLGLHPSTLRSRIKKLGLKRP